MKAEIVVIGGGASGLMSAYHAAATLANEGVCAQVTVLEKMPRPARKLMITGKGRCNFTNVKDWNDFSGHIRSKVPFIKSAFYNLTPEKLVDFFDSFGMKSVIERGDRAFPTSYHASDVVDTLVLACNSVGVKIVTGIEVLEVRREQGGFALDLSDSSCCHCKALILATGGLSDPTTGSSGDGYRFASSLGHHITPTFPSLTALVPALYKEISKPDGLHIDRSEALSPLGESLKGVQLKNVRLSLEIEGTVADSEFGDLDFTDGGMEGPLGFQLSRKAVKSMLNGSRCCLELDLKPGVDLTELTERVKALWKEVDTDPRSRRLREKEKCRILLGKLMPWDLIPGFNLMNPDIITVERRGRRDTKVWINLPTIAKRLKAWRFPLAGFVGYERCVVTAGGVDTDEIIAKTMASRLVEGLYFCGELMDFDADTGGYNLQGAFCTGALAGRNSALFLSQNSQG